MLWYLIPKFSFYLLFTPQFGRPLSPQHTAHTTAIYEAQATKEENTHRNSDFDAENHSDNGSYGDNVNVGEGGGDEEEEEELDLS
jgi:hypothetical protein